MKKIIELKNVIEFYTLANKLKTKNIFTFQTVALEPPIEEPIRLAARK